MPGHRTVVGLGRPHNDLRQSDGKHRRRGCANLDLVAGTVVPENWPGTSGNPTPEYMSARQWWFRVRRDARDKSLISRRPVLEGRGCSHGHAVAGRKYSIIPPNVALEVLKDMDRGQCPGPVYLRKKGADIGQVYELDGKSAPPEPLPAQTKEVEAFGAILRTALHPKRN